MKFRAPIIYAIVIVLTTSIILPSCGSNKLTFSKGEFFKRKKSNQVEKEVLVKALEPSSTQANNPIQEAIKKSVPGKESIKKEMPIKEIPIGIWTIEPKFDISSNAYLFSPSKSQNQATPSQELHETSTQNSQQRSKDKIEKVNKELAMTKKALSREEMSYYLIAILLPFLAVGLITDWDLTMVVISVLLMLGLWIPLVIHTIL